MDQPVPIRVETTLPLDLDRDVFVTTRGHRHRVFEPTHVDWWARRYEDDRVLVAAVAGEDVRHDSADVWASWKEGDTLPDWCPGAPAWFAEAVAAMGYPHALPTHD